MLAGMNCEPKRDKGPFSSVKPYQMQKGRDQGDPPPRPVHTQQQELQPMVVYRIFAYPMMVVV